MNIKLSLQQAVIAGAVIIILLSFLFFFLVWRPMKGRLDQVRQEQTEEIKKARSAQVTLQRLQQLKQQAPEIESQLIELSRRMPEDPAIPSLIIELQQLANESGLNFVSFTPSQPTELGNYSSLPIDMTLQGYFNRVREDGGSLLDFLYRLEHFPREIKVVSVNITPGTDGLPALSITMKAETYIFGGQGKAQAQGGK